MAIPVIAAIAAAQIVSAGVQWLNSSRAMDASNEERAKMTALLNSLQDPNFDTTQIAPEDLAVVQRYIPETAPFIQEVFPEQVRAQSQGALEGRSAQMAALGKMRQLMDQGYDIQTAIEMARAQRGASAEATSARQSAMQEASRRGFGAGPSFYNAGAQQAGQDRLAQAQQAALQDAAQRRFQATQQAGAMGSQIRGEDVNLESQNINAINAFNQRMAARGQDWANQQTAARNQAQLQNISESQRVADQNKMNKYNSQVQNQQLRNTTAQQQYNNAMGKITGQQANSALNQNAMWQNAAQQNQAIQSVGDLAGKLGSVYYQNQQDQANDKWRDDWLKAQQDRYTKG